MWLKMAETHYLHGAEDVRTASNTMRNAADDMRSAGSSMEEAARNMNVAAASIGEFLDSHQRFMTDWLQAFREIMATAQPTIVISADPPPPIHR